MFSLGLCRFSTDNLASARALVYSHNGEFVRANGCFHISMCSSVKLVTCPWCNPTFAPIQLG